MRLGVALPDDHRSADSKDILKMSLGLMDTMVALVLCLLVASAKSLYDTRSAEVMQMAAQVFMLDRRLPTMDPSRTRRATASVASWSIRWSESAHTSAPELPLWILPKVRTLSMKLSANCRRGMRNARC
jgi:hypothetical protein